MRTRYKPTTNAHRTSQGSEYTANREYASAWRSYRRPDAVVSPGAEGARALAGTLDGATRRAREWQRDQIRRTGYATPQAELGHAIALALRERGYPLTVAHVAGQLGAVGTAYNWQGNARIAGVLGRSKRTVQRARARLEADGLIRSELLLTGDMIDGQRAPVRHPQVVRDVSRLQRLARARDAARETNRPRKGRRRRSAAEVPAPSPLPPTSPATAIDLLAMAADPNRSPDAAFFLLEQARAAWHERIDPERIAEWERMTAELEQRLEQRRERARLEREERERGPPDRAPPN